MSDTMTAEHKTTARRDALNESHVWQVYARRKYEEPLHEIGNVMADDVELAKVYFIIPRMRLRPHSTPLLSRPYGYESPSPTGME